MKHIILTGSLILFTVHFCTAQSWKKVAEIPNETIYSFEVQNHTAYAGAADRVYIGSNDGASWRSATPFSSDVYVLAVTEFHDKLYAGTGRGGVWTSSDGGASWRSLSSGLVDPGISSFAVWNNELYAGSLGNGFYKLDEAGGQWKTFNPGFFTNVDGNVSQVVTTDSTLIAAAGLNGIFYSFDSSARGWDYFYYLATLAPGLKVSGLLFDSARTLYAASPSRLTLFSSADRGRTWLADNNGMHVGDPVLTADDRYDYVAVSYLASLPAGYEVKIYQRSLHAPAGSAWTATDSLPGAYFYALGVAGGRLFSATDSGLYYKGASIPPALHPDNSDQPFIFPNPASGQVNITLHLQLPQSITVHIYDAAGRLVATPLRNYAWTPGRQVVTLNIPGLSKGVYVLDASTRDKHYTGRLIVR